MPKTRILETWVTEKSWGSSCNVNHSSGEFTPLSPKTKQCFQAARPKAKRPAGVMYVLSSFRCRCGNPSCTVHRQTLATKDNLQVDPCPLRCLEMTSSLHCQRADPHPPTSLPWDISWSRQSSAGDVIVGPLCWASDFVCLLGLPTWCCIFPVGTWKTCILNKHCQTRTVGEDFPKAVYRAIEREKTKYSDRAR